MNSTKPSLPKGTRDFSPEQMAKRLFIMDAIRHTFQLYGFLPLETPAMENLSVLTGKYGEEGDQLLFKILNSGDFLADVTTEDINKGSKHLSASIAEKGLRYDLTVPLARFIVMNRHELIFPFKRYQMQPVWRADRPQKGRYREFYQCDADMIGSTSLIGEAEIIWMAHDLFSKIGLTKFVIFINHRKILKAIANHIDQGEQETTLCTAIDKLDKIGIDKVKEELSQKNFSKESLHTLESILSINGSNDEKIEQLKKIIGSSDIGKEGIKELELLLTYAKLYPRATQVEINLTLARGLSYYTGSIFEIKATEVAIGSIGGGGRYDNLTDLFGLPNTSGVGISFGIDRIYDVLEEMKLFPKHSNQSPKILITNFDSYCEKESIKVIHQLRASNISSELYPEPAKLKKQLSYADAKQIPFVIIIGEEEVQKQAYTLKDMHSGEQHTGSIEDLLKFIKVQ